jgi:hypothetical protein
MPGRQEEFPRPEDIWTYYVRASRATAELQKLLYRYFREKSGLRHAVPEVALGIGKRAILSLPDVPTYGLKAL